MSSLPDPDFEKKIAEAQEDFNELHLVNKNQSLVENDNTPIHFPEETWEEIVTWIKRMELAQHVSLVSDKLFCITYPFMHEEKKHRLPTIVINGGDNKPWAKIKYEDGSERELSKTEVPTHFDVSENIVGEMSRIRIRKVDGDVVLFMQLLAPIHPSVSLYVNFHGFSFREIQNPNMVKLMDLLKGKIEKLIIGSGYDLSRYPFLLDETSTLSTNDCLMNEILELIKDWLYKPKYDAKPKVFDYNNSFYAQDFVEIIKEDFVTAEQPSFFIIRFRTYASDGDFSFNAVNEVTGERLSIQEYETSGYLRVWLLGRLSMDCEKSVREVYNEIDHSMKSLPRIGIVR